MITNLSLFKLIYSLNRISIFSNGLSLFLGEYLIYVLAVSACAYLALGKSSKKDKAKWLLVLVLACCLSNMIVNPLIHCFYKLPRPFVVLTEIVNYKNFLKITEYNTSFSSGHTSLAFAIAIVLFIKNKKIGVIALSIATLICMGRILIGVHWPLDVFGGIGVGSLCALIAYEIINKCHD